MIARWMVVGFVLWIAVAALFRFVGQDYFQAGQGVMWFFLTLPIATLVVTYALFKIMRVASTDRAEAASIMVVPGLIVGIYEITNYATVFPNLDVGLNGAFASLMFACYTAMILAGIVASRLQSI